MHYHYYIINNAETTDKQGLTPGVFIVQTEPTIPLNITDGEGPFSSMLSLKRNSNILKNLRRTNSARAQKIILDKNIIKSERIMLTPKGMVFSQDIVDMFIHATIGRVIKGKVTGVHFYDKNKVKLLKILRENTETGVFEAEIEFLNPRTRKWIKKTAPSTFFPRNWNMSLLIQYCKLAYESIEKEQPKNGKIISKTNYNIKVEMYFKDGVIKTLYPLL
nr:EndoU domain-containing protein [uncultured Psychroserpens sp.]